MNNNLLEQVKEFRYLEITLPANGRCSIEIKKRIAKAKKNIYAKNTAAYKQKT